MGRDDGGEEAPSVIVHLFEVRMPGNSGLLMVPPLLKHAGRSHFSRLCCHLPADAGTSPSVWVTAAADGWSILSKTHREARALGRLAGKSASRVCDCASVSDSSSKRSKQMTTSQTIRADLIGRHSSRTPALQSESSDCQGSIADVWPAYEYRLIAFALLIKTGLLSKIHFLPSLGRI